MLRNASILPVLTRILFGIAVLLAPVIVHAAEEAPMDAAALLQELENLPDGEPVWDRAAAIASQDGEATRKALLDAADSPQPQVALAAGYALLRLGEQREGARALEALVRNREAPLDRRTAAAAALGVEGGEYASSRVRVLLTDRTLHERIQVELAKSLWRLTRAQTAQDRLRALLKADSTRARHEAAVALATFAPLGESVALLKDLVFLPGDLGEEVCNALKYRARAALIAGNFEEVAPLLRELSQYPSLDLGTAGLLLDVSHWGGVDTTETEDQFASELVNEVIDKIRENYAPDESATDREQRREQDRLDSRNLATTAAKAIANEVDPFSDYLNTADITQMAEQMEGEYGGIGAWVGMRNQRFTILLPMYGQPAFEAGLRAMDWIEKIEGKPLSGMSQEEIVKMLKGQPGTTVEMLVWRRGWTKPQTFTVTRRKITIPSVQGRMLPDKIGYVRIQRFGSEETTPVELEETLDRLEDEGMRALVLDLTNNPGGMLSTAVQVADKFLEGRKLIVYSQGRPGVHDRKDYYSHGRGTHPGLPMAVLVNGSSASASEIVAGALRDHDRATLVGEKTYGKGSVQQLLWLNTTNRRTALKLTIAKYYLPNGDCIHNQGIAPDIEESMPEIPMRSVEARLKLRSSQRLTDYVRRAFPKYEDKMRQLLAFDHEDPYAYPEFEQLLDGIHEVGIEVDPEDVRLELRRALMTYLESERGEEVLVDLEENLPLQRAVLHLREQLEDNREDIPVYAWAEREVERRLAQAQEEASEELYPPPPGKRPGTDAETNAEE